MTEEGTFLTYFFLMTFHVDCHQRLNVLSLTDGDPPISPLQLPAYCGYSVKMSWSDVKLMMPYDACYITQEVCWRLYFYLAVQTNQSRSVQFISMFVFPQNGSYVLPVLWLGHPLKLLCPVQTPVPFLSPSVFCSSYGMAVQIDGQQPDILMMKVTSEFKAINEDVEEMFILYRKLILKLSKQTFIHDWTILKIFIEGLTFSIYTVNWSFKCTFINPKGIYVVV